MHGLHVIEEKNNPYSDTTSKRAYQLQKKEKAFAAVEGFKAKPLAPSQIQQMLKDTIADSFAAVKRLDAKENAGSQNQKRTQTLTDRDVLSMAADRILSIDAISMDAAVSDALGILIQQNLQKGMNKMSQEEKKQAEEFVKDFSKLDHGDQRYVQGWVDAKAARQQEKKEQKEA